MTTRILTVAEAIYILDTIFERLSAARVIADKNVAINEDEYSLGYYNGLNEAMEIYKKTMPK